MSGAGLFYLWVTPYAYALFSPAQAASQTAIVALCWGLVLIRLDQQHPSLGPPSQLIAKWVLTMITVVAVGVLVRALSRSLRDVDRRFHRSFADSGIGAAFLSTDLVWLEVNDALCRTLGFSSDELVGRPSREIADCDIIAEAHATVPTVDNQVVEEEQRYLRPDGSTAWVDVTASLVVPEVGDPYVFAQYRDISDHKQAQSQLSYQAAHDPLTGLANRGNADEKARSGPRAAVEPRHGVGVILLDLDQFKIVNDSLGHHIGDQV